MGGPAENFQGLQPDQVLARNCDMAELLEGLLVGLWEILAELFSGILWSVLELWLGLWGSILVLLNLMLMLMVQNWTFVFCSLLFWGLWITFRRLRLG